MATKHRLPLPETDQEPAAKRSRQEAPLGTQDTAAAATRVELNPADCDLDFNIDGNGLQGHPLTAEGFAYCWSGARATVGIIGGKYCFGCKIISEQVVNMADTPSDQQHLCRVGISKGDDPVGNLGETTNSFGFGGTGKFSYSGKFSDYGTKFGVGDTIICTVDLENKAHSSIGFSKNGKSLGVAKHFDASLTGLGVVGMPHHNLPWKSALFPHVLLKNVEVQLQFSREDGLIPEEGYKPWSSALQDGNGVIGPSFASPSQCEVIMMVGLPASGKTTWAEKWIKEHPEKRYVLLGTNLALDQMKVPGLLRKNNYGGRFERLMSHATGIFNTLLARAAKTPRNYILDQTNVYKSARNRKLKAFMNYYKIAVVIFPTLNELRVRADTRFKEMGKEVPAEAVNEMIANYALPMTKNMRGSNELFDEVIFPELGREEAQRQLDEMKRSLISPNSNANTVLPSCSNEGSIQSFRSPNVANVGAASGSPTLPSAASEWLASRPSLSLHDSLTTTQVNRTHSSPGHPEDHRTRLGYNNLPRHIESPYSNYSNYETTSSPGSIPRPYESYGSRSIFSGNTYGTSSMPFGDARPYQENNTSDAFERFRVDRLSSSRMLDYESPLAPPPLTRGPDGQYLDPPLPLAGHPTAMPPQYAYQSPHRSFHARGSSYGAPSPTRPVRSFHGSSYGAPSPTRPPYGSPPYQRHPRPGQRYH